MKVLTQSNLIFVMSTALAMLCVLAENGVAYLAPLLATAAVLANGSTAKIRLATIFSYALCFLIGLFAAHYFSPTPLLLMVFGGLAYFLSRQMGQQHPPALAMLVLVFMRHTDSVLCVGLMLVVGMMTLSAWMITRTVSA